jgi:tRNA threonylcarbamoyladenosine biosynthesis protein TsaE
VKTLIERSYRIEEVDEIALELKALLLQCKVMTLQGSLGAGKTTLVQSLLRSCGVNDIITSPTFTYVNRYEGGSGNIFYHFDCYRLESVQAFMNAGLGEYLYAPGSWSLIEWPEVVESLLTESVCHVMLEYEGAESRRIVATIL